LAAVTSGIIDEGVLNAVIVSCTNDALVDDGASIVVVSEPFEMEVKTSLSALVTVDDFSGKTEYVQPITARYYLVRRITHVHTYDRLTIHALTFQLSF
jgi:hypothetical protein